MADTNDVTPSDSSATTWRYQYVPRVHMQDGERALDALCDEGWEPFAATSGGGGDITVHVRKQVENRSEVSS